MCKGEMGNKPGFWNGYAVSFTHTTPGHGPRHGLRPRRDLTAAGTNHRALRAWDGHTPVQRRLRTPKERLSGVAVFPQPSILCVGREETPVHMHVGCAYLRLHWPHYRQTVQEAARHLPPRVERYP